MKRHVEFICLIVGLAMTGLVFSGCGKGPSGNQAKSTATQAEKAEPSAKKVLYWTCSMHPTVHSKKPGKCPTCGMTLVPVYKTGTQSGKNTSAKKQ